MDNKNIEEIYSSYAKDLYRYAMFKLNNKDKAEDVVSETFTLFINQMGKGNIESPKLYLFGIARNVIFKQYKEKSHSDLEEIIEDVKDSSEINFEKKILDEELTSILKEELKNLDPKTQEIIILKVWESLQFNEIANLTQLNESTVKLKFYRGIEKLKSLVEAKEPKLQKTYSFTLPLLLSGVWTIGQSPTLLIDSAMLAKIMSGIALNLNFINQTMTTATAVKSGVLSFINSKILIGATVATVGAVGLGVGGAVYVNETNTSDSNRLEVTDESNLDLNNDSNTDAENNEDSEDCGVRKYTNSNYPGFEFDYDSCKWLLDEQVESRNVTAANASATYTNVVLTNQSDSNSVLTFGLTPNFITGVGPKQCSTPTAYDYVRNDILWVSEEPNTYSYLYDFVEGKKYFNSSDHENGFDFVICSSSDNKNLTLTQESVFPLAPFSSVLQGFTNPNLNIITSAILETNSDDVKAESDEIIKTLKLGATRDVSYFESNMNFRVDVPAGWYFVDKATVPVNASNNFRIFGLQNEKESWLINFQTIATDSGASGGSTINGLPGTTYSRSTNQNPRTVTFKSGQTSSFRMESGKTHEGKDRVLWGQMMFTNSAGTIIYINYGANGQLTTIEALPDYDATILPILSEVYIGM